MMMMMVMRILENIVATAGLIHLENEYRMGHDSTEHRHWHQEDHFLAFLPF